MDFGMALIALKRGECVARGGWNGKRQYLSLGTEFTYIDRNGKANAEHQTSGTAAIVFHGTIGVRDNEPANVMFNWPKTDYKNAHQFKLDVNRIARKKNYLV